MHRRRSWHWGVPVGRAGKRHGVQRASNSSASMLWPRCCVCVGMRCIHGDRHGQVARMLSTLAFIREESMANIWMISCLIGGLPFIAIGARAGGLALLGAVPGAFIGLMVGSNFDLLPRNIMVGASV